jgi:hypothetical protein
LDEDSISMGDGVAQVSVANHIVTVDGGAVNINGTAWVKFTGGMLKLGGGSCRKVSGVGDVVSGGNVPAGGGPVSGAEIVTGSNNVFLCA